MHMYRQPQQTNTGGSRRKEALGTGWRWWLQIQSLFNNCFIGSRIEHQCHSMLLLTWYHPKFGSQLVVCQSHSMPAWIVFRLTSPCTWHRRGLTSTVVAKTYAALATVQDYRPVQPRNSNQGLHYCAMGATRTQASTLLVLLVLTKLAWRPQV